jgi:hypothetical protein
MFFKPGTTTPREKVVSEKKETKKRAASGSRKRKGSRSPGKKRAKSGSRKRKTSRSPGKKRAKSGSRKRKTSRSPKRTSPSRASSPGRKAGGKQSIAQRLATAEEKDKLLDVTDYRSDGKGEIKLIPKGNREFKAGKYPFVDGRLVAKSAPGFGDARRDLGRSGSAAAAPLLSSLAAAAGPAAASLATGAAGLSLAGLEVAAGAGAGVAKSTAAPVPANQLTPSQLARMSEPAQARALTAPAAPPATLPAGGLVRSPRAAATGATGLGGLLDAMV